MRIARVVGARPQFMQLPALMAALKEAGHEQVLVHTGQHYDHNMSEQFFADMGLPRPDINLEIGSGSHGAATGRIVERFEQTLREILPDAVVVDGDTNSTLGAALAAVKLHIPVVHIEAGLRDFDRRRPEEINRILTDHASELNCAPIPRALENLRHEGLGPRSVLTGDVLLDCFDIYRPRRSMRVREELGLAEGGYHVMTLHRPENTDLSEEARFNAIMSVVTSLDKPVVLAVHPRTQPIIDRFRAQAGGLGSLKVIPPVSYFEMLGLLDGCDCVLTDSGGLPREAAWSGKRCVMLFRVDTWHDLLGHGWATIGKTDSASIRSAFEAARPADAAAARAFFGGGQSARRIVAALDKLFS
jgi:UDP-N-acetylglucosamine 2-epimerase